MDGMTTEQIRSHEKAMAEQRKQFQRLWDNVIEPSLPPMDCRTKGWIMHRAWNLWRNEFPLAAEHNAPRQTQSKL